MITASRIQTIRHRKVVQRDGPCSYEASRPGWRTQAICCESVRITSWLICVPPQSAFCLSLECRAASSFEAARDDNELAVMEVHPVLA